ncbi:MAG: hypothetical protein RJA46_53 [Pseudomonadota bacterium]
MILNKLFLSTLAAIALTCAGNNVWAKDAVPLADDPVTEQRLIAISEEMRCLVCQNESLAGSRSDLANDLRREIRILIHEGKTDEQIRNFMVERYGDFVLYRPPVKPITWASMDRPFCYFACWHYRSDDLPTPKKSNRTKHCLIRRGQPSY